MPTIKQVANVAGVSFKTVSRVINDDPNVSDATRDLVQRVIRELGYRPNLAARHMRTQRSQVIGFITDEIATTPFAFNMIKGAQAEAWQHDRLLLVVNTESDARVCNDAIEMMLERKVEGIVYATMRHSIFDPPSNMREVPTVLANCESEDQSLASVVPDEVTAAQVATEALLKKGHRRIAFISLEEEVPAAIGRLKGYQRALSAFGVDYDAGLLRHTDGNPALGYERAVELLALATPPTAFFCGNDRVAMGAYEAIKERGLRIPEDVAVVGFDNQEVIAANLRPALSTMALPHYEMGQWAVKQLLQPPIDGGKPPHVLLSCPYVERLSL